MSAHGPSPRGESSQFWRTWVNASAAPGGSLDAPPSVVVCAREVAKSEMEAGNAKARRSAWDGHWGRRLASGCLDEEWIQRVQVQVQVVFT